LTELSTKAWPTAGDTALRQPLLLAVSLVSGLLPNRLDGKISLSALSSCDVSVAALSVGGPLPGSRLCQRNFLSMLDLL
jgi:hypothetical protein